MTKHNEVDNLIREALREADSGDWLPDVAAARAELDRRRMSDVGRAQKRASRFSSAVKLFGLSVRFQPLAIAIAVVIVTLTVPAVVLSAIEADTALAPAGRPAVSTEPSDNATSVEETPKWFTPPPSNSPAPSTAPPVSATADARSAEPDITSDDRAVVLPSTPAGRCEDTVEGATLAEERPYVVGGTVVAVLEAYYSALRHQACAKLVKPDSSPLLGQETHLALTLCGDGNSCSHDWGAYAVDAGPVVVVSEDGCMSFRVSMLDATGTDWLIRDRVAWFGCE